MMMMDDQKEKAEGGQAEFGHWQFDAYGHP